MSKQTNYKPAFILLTALFFLIGFLTVLVDSLIPRLRELFTLSYFEAGLVQFAFFLAYFVFSIPSASIINKVGYKNGIVIGLLTMSLGCLLFYPAAAFRQLGIFLSGYFILAGGMTILQVAMNPFIAALGSEKSASSRLTLSQAFNSLGTAIAPSIGALFILGDRIKTKEEIEFLTESTRKAYLLAEASAVQQPFIVLSAIIGLLVAVLYLTKLPAIINKSSGGTYLQALKKKNLLLGVFGIFFYVGAEVAIGSYLVNYFLDMNLAELIRNSDTMRAVSEFWLSKELDLLDKKAVVGIFVTFYWLGAMIGRFFGAYLTRIFNPGQVVAVFAFCAVTLLFISMNTEGLIAMWSILLVGFFNSIMFPTIFTLAIDGLKELKPKASGLLCMAIVGGAIIPPLYGFFTDNFGFKLALIVMMACYGYILFYGYFNYKRIKKGVADFQEA